MPARTPTRNASCGVKRYGSDVRGSGGRKRRDGERRSGYELANEPHLDHAVAGGAAENAPAERQDGVAEQHVQDDAREQGLEEGAAGGDLLAEEEVEAVADERDCDGGGE